MGPRPALTTITVPSSNRPRHREAEEEPIILAFGRFWLRFTAQIDFVEGYLLLAFGPVVFFGAVFNSLLCGLFRPNWLR
jgi:hypothetical protein